MLTAPSAQDLSRYRREELLRDGYRVLFRPIEKSDAPLWLAFMSRLSDRARYIHLRHFPVQMTDEDALLYCTVDYDNTFAYVAEIGLGEERKIIAVARYYRLPNRRAAKVAFVTEDDYRNIGLGSRLIQVLADAAREKGIAIFEANVLHENKQMMEAFRGFGFHVSSVLEDGIYHVEFPIRHTRAVDLKQDYRDRVATVASLQSFVNPKSVAIIGAARSPGTIGNLLMRCILQSGFSGTVYPVNPNAESVLSVKSYPSVLDVPGKVDMAIIAVPAPVVARVADECGRKGIRGLIVISDGFRERGPEGAAREDQLRNITLSYGMRLVGPNCMGLINTAPGIKLNASFSQIFPDHGNVAFLSQSGAMGLTILQHVKDLNMGISSFVSVGNRADVSPNDFLQYWEQDPATKIILLYMESFGNPKEFARIARRVSAKKPLVVVKSGSTAAGARAASSHTGALATSDMASDVLFQNAGIIRVNAVEELFDVATLLSTQPLPKGRRLAIVTNGGGPGIIAADAAARNGLEVPELSAATRAKIKASLSREIAPGNPIDTTAGATAPEFEGILRALAADKDIDAVLAIFAPPIIIETQQMEDALRRVAPVFFRSHKPIIACFIGQKGLSAQLGAQKHFIPLYTFPEEAILSLRRAVEYSEMRCRPQGKIPSFKDIETKKARQLISTVIKNSTARPLWLSPEEIDYLLHCYGIRQPQVVFARTLTAARAAAVKMGYPVAVKLASSTITHKSDVGGVILNVASGQEVERAYRAVRKNLEKIGRLKEMSGVTVQRMMKGGIETIVGVSQDPTFGPLMMFGSGGIYAELIKDVSVRLHPITDRDAADMIKSVKLSRLLEGYRGAPPADISALQDLLLRVSAMVEDNPEITELDLNPVTVMPEGKGCWVVDARISVR